MWDSVFQGVTIMKIMRDYPQVTVSKKGERWLDNGHPWVYESDVTGITGNHENGDIVDVDLGPTCRVAVTLGFLSRLSKVVQQSDTSFVPSGQIYFKQREPKPWEV
jgi:hypothetical protein